MVRTGRNNHLRETIVCDASTLFAKAARITFQMNLPPRGRLRHPLHHCRPLLFLISRRLLAREGQPLLYFLLSARRWPTLLPLSSDVCCSFQSDRRRALAPFICHPRASPPSHPLPAMFNFAPVRLGFQPVALACQRSRKKTLREAPRIYAVFDVSRCSASSVFSPLISPGILASFISSDCPGHSDDLRRDL